MPSLSIRWSELEATKEYASPFAVGFLDDSGENIATIAVGGRELVYYTDFQAAVMRLLGEMFLHPEVEAAPLAQMKWLDVLSQLLPATGNVILRPVSTFDHTEGRTVRIDVIDADRPVASLAADTLLSYQEAQALIAHQSGMLFRVGEIEAIDDDPTRQRAWTAWISNRLEKMGPDYAVAGWSWRSPT